MPDLMEDHIRKLMNTRFEQLDKLAAAFIMEVGSGKASEYSLVESRSEDGRTTTWTFKANANRPPMWRPREPTDMFWWGKEPR